MLPNFLYKEESKQLLGIAMQLHRELGCGFKEKVYQDAFEVLLKENDIPYEREKHIGVELKAYSEITGEFESQLINYLHVGNQQLGLLLNFGTTSLEYKFIPNRPNYKKIRGYWSHYSAKSRGCCFSK